jgi:23S rRNA pseudouridine1911/1915/1917 synthase
MFRKGEVHKTYHAIIPKLPFLTKSSTPTLLTHYLTRNEKQNKAYAHTKEIQGSKKATLDFQLLQSSDRYALLQVNLHTGRHHQIRCQLATALAPIKGDLKYGSPRSNPDGSICLHARNVSFIHPVSKQEIIVLAPYPTLPIWDVFNQ